MPTFPLRGPAGGDHARIALSTLVALAGLAAFTGPADAGSLFDFLFGPRQAAPRVNPFESYGPGPAAQPMRSSGYCVRTCDGRYFPVTAQGRASTAEMCDAFCPASETRVYSGGSIDHAVADDGSRYHELKNAYLYRQRLVTNCTCNGRDSAGLAAVDLATDPTLRKGDIVAASDGLYAYGGPSFEGRPGGDFTPVASYPGLGADVRARLGEMKVLPGAAEMPPPLVTGSVTPQIRRAQLE